MIDTFFMILKKGLVAIIFTMFGFVMVYTPLPHHDGGYHNVEQAEAGASVVMEIGSNLVQNIYTAVQTAAIWVIENWIYLKESGLDMLAWTLTKDILSDMTADIVDWVNSDHDGKQKFIVSMRDILLEEADIAVGEFINSLPDLDFLCDPFKFQVQLAVALQYDADREKRPRAECTLSDVIDNIEDFLAGDFVEQGGWVSWLEVTQNAEANTPGGAAAVAQRLTAERAAEAKEEAKRESIQNNGFVSTKKCDPVVGPAGERTNCYVTTPANVISEQLNKVVGSGFDQLVEADEVNEIVSLLVSSLQSGIFNEDGLSGLSGNFNYSGYNRGTTFTQDLRDNTLIDTPGGNDGGFDDFGADPGDLHPNPQIAFMQSTIAEAQALLDEIVDYYIPELNDYLNNPNNNDVNNDIDDPAGNIHPDYPINILTGEIYLDQMEDLRDRTIPDLDRANEILDEMILLDAQYATADPTEQATISAEMADLAQEFSLLGLLTQGEFNAYARNADDLLATDIPFQNNNNNCNIDPWAPGCPCDLDPNGPQCLIDPCDLDPNAPGCPCAGQDQNCQIN